MAVYINGGYFPNNRAKVSVFDRGFLLGDGIFETVRAYNRKIFRLDDHLDRLFQSASGVRLSVPHTRDEFSEIIFHVLEKNRLKNALIRITITRGEGEVGSILPSTVKPTVVISSRPFAGYPVTLYEKGIKIITVKEPHLSGTRSGIKSTSFQNNVLVKIQAQQKGVDDAVVLDDHDYVTEGTTSNIFIVRERRLITPSPEIGILDGITRRTVMDLAGGQGIRVRETLISYKDLYEADECFLTNTSLEIMPVVAVDKHFLGSGHPGPLTILLMKAFREKVRRMVRG